MTGDSKKNHLRIDLETYSDVPLGDCGVYRYVESPAFEILLFGYSYNDSPAVTVDLKNGERIPDSILLALKDGNTLKHAFNAAFEWACLSKVYGYMPPSQWRDTMLACLYAGYPASLEAAGAALGMPEDKRKLNTGKTLIRYFCVPCKPTRINGMRTRNMPWHDTEKWELFKTYNIQDVVTEGAIDTCLTRYPVPDFIQKQWETDLTINARGVAVDMYFVHGAIAIREQATQELTAEAVKISGLSNPNSVSQLTSWLNQELKESATVDNLRKETVSQLLSVGGIAENVQRMLEIRQELGKSSIKKYHAIEACECADGRVRGLLQYYGANRTGRWAGRLVQVQNLPRTYIGHLDTARKLVKERKAAHLKMIYGNVSDTVSQLIRTAFIATPGNVLIDADFSAIEARVIAWLAGEEWRLEIFRTTGKIYEASAAMIFHVPVETIVKGNPNYALRQRGKVAELALGYQGGVGAMRRMDTAHALDEVPDEEVKSIVQNWRNASPKIRNLWYDMENAALEVIENGGSVPVRCLTFAREYDLTTNKTCMTVKLPSGRKLYYVEPTIVQNKKGFPSIVYIGVNQESKKWGPIETYGGKLTENVVQAIARDCLAEAIERLEASGFPIIFHIHDEVVIDIHRFADDDTMLKKVAGIMSQPPTWATGLPLTADGWVGNFFKKD